MIIPSEIQLAGITIKTEASGIKVGGKRMIGVADYDLERIVIDLKAAPIDSVNQTYIHEVLHYVLQILGYDEINSDEQFIDSVAHLLYQAIISAKYEKLSKKEYGSGS